MVDKVETLATDEQLSMKPEEKNTDKKNESVTATTNTLGQVNFINGSKCLYAPKGTSLLAIASRFNVGLRKLLDINELEDDGILEDGQLIFLQKKSKTGDKDFVVVQKKETLYDVAQRNGIQLESLLEYNQFNEDGDVKPGTKLYLKAVAETDQAKVTIAKAAAFKTIIYQVQPREGLNFIAKKNNVTVEQLREWNSLTSNDIKIGQQLIIRK